MVIIGLLFASLFALTPVKMAKNVKEDYKSALITQPNERGNYTLIGVDDSSFGSEFRLYHYDDLLIDEVSDTAFNGTTFTSLMLTRSVTYIDDDVFDNASNIKNLFFTGSETEYQSLNLSHSFTGISYYAKDEGFIYFWNTEIRPTKDTNICSISKATFNKVYSLYKQLDKNDLQTVDNYVDLAGAKIADSMKQLVNYFAESKPSRKNDEWNQAGAITLIIFIAVLGMTSITVFFLLKTKHIID